MKEMSKRKTQASAAKPKPKTRPKPIAKLKQEKFCEEHLHGRYDLEIIDIYQQPQLLKGEQIIAAPTLIKKLPLPLRKFIGDLSDSERILMGLDLRTKD